MKRFFVAFLSLWLCLFLLAPTVTLACGPFSLEPVFVFTVHPPFPLERFARGEIGVVQPSYARSYLVVAYRHLSDLSFNQQEQRLLTELWKERLDYGWDLGSDEWIKNWLEARQKVTGLSQPAKIEVYRNREKPNEYETFLNCQKDAFDNAIKTLNALIAKFGADAPGVVSWVAAQDQVFSNCGEGQQIPATAEHPLLRADRDYQIAAANFYSTNFDEATKRFDAIANDNSSPWQSTAPYLAARSLVRKASLASAENKEAPLSQAEQRLIKILANNKSADTQKASSRLLDLVRLRLRPAERLHELAKRLVTKSDASLKQDLWDYTILLDGFLERSAEEKAKFMTEARRDDITDWIVTMQSSSDEALTHSLSKWRETHSNAWFVASLSKVDGLNSSSSQLIAQALKIEPGSPAFPSASFHAVRLLREANKASDARKLIDQLLQTNRTKIDISTQNLLLSQRFALAINLSEMLESAPRIPAALSWDEDGREIPSSDEETSADKKALQTKPFFDVDAATVFNKHVPLSMLKDAAKSELLPMHLRKDMAQATWLRAVLLDDFNTADELTPLMKSLYPQLNPLLDKFATAQTPAAKKFAAIFLWLRTPGFEPVVDQGVGRESVVTKQDTYRDNWWCAAAYAGSEIPPDTGDDEEELPSFTAISTGTPSFLTTQEKSAALKEYSILKNFGAAPNYLARQVIQFANSSPTDPRVPEALHLAVNSTRYGCTDKNSGRWSKAAFDLLHNRYGTTTWAKKTKYWFKD